MRTALGGLLVLLVAGCGGSSNMSNDAGSDMTGPGFGSCTMTLSGAVSGTFTCAVGSVFSVADHSGGVSFSVASPAPLQAITASITRPGMVTTGTWTQGDAGASSGLAVMQGGVPPPSWVASAGSQNMGSYTLNLTAATVIATVNTGTSYDVHGTLDATLPAEQGSGGTGSVMMHASF
jgi:hypothetical protein